MSLPRLVLTGIVFFAVVCALIPSSSIQAQSDIPLQVIERVNALRASYGVPAYHIDPILMQVAQSQAEWSAANNHIGHDGPGGSRPNDRARSGGYGGGNRAYATENAAHGSGTMDPDWVMTGWQSDSIHLDAMISSSYEDVGVGYAEANGYFWCVLMVGRVEGSGAAEAAQEPDENVPAATPLIPPAAGVRRTALPDGSVMHIVEHGESPWSIAALYELSLTDLLALNHLSEDSILHPGDTLIIQPTPTLTATEQASTTPDNTSATTPPTPIPTSVRETAPPPSDTRSTIRLLPWGLLVVGLGMVTASIVFGKAWKAAGVK